MFEEEIRKMDKVLSDAKRLTEHIRATQDPCSECPDRTPEGSCPKADECKP